MSTELWVTADELSDPSSPDAHRAAMSASWLLWALSGRRYGGAHQITERYECPCRCTRRPFTYGYGIYPVYPAYHYGEIYNVSICEQCGNEHRLRLRGRPIHSIEKVVAGGNVLDEASYEIHDSRYLAYSGFGTTPWNLCNTIEVSYTYGAAPPETGRRAARLLAQELLLATTDPDRCRLPDRVTSVSRQGVSFTILDPQSFLDEGRLGIYEVDAFLRAVNPDKARRPSRVFSPDEARGVRVRRPRPAAPEVGPYDLAVQRGIEFTRLFTAAELSTDLTGVAWHPTGQVSSWNGATVLTLDDYLSGVGDPPGTVRITFPVELTTASTLRNGVYDVYAVLEADGNTVIHILTGQVLTT